jgi:hypothetical protein
VIQPEEAVHFLGDLRLARATALADGENAAALLTCFERLGYHLEWPLWPSGLGSYRAKLLALANRSRVSDALACDRCQSSVADIFDSVLDGRNEAMHVGVSARRLVDHAVRLALFLENGLMADLKLVKHFMVADPVRAHSWQTVAHVRQQMLVNQFSYIPYEHPSGSWRLIPDYSVAAYLRASDDLGDALAKTVGEVVPNQMLKTESAVLIPANAPVNALLKAPTEVRPWLVVEGKEQVLRGILTAFDLL